VRVATALQNSVVPLLGNESVATAAQPATTPWQTPRLWQSLCLALALLWVGTFIAWRRARATPGAHARAPGHGPASTPSPPSSLKRACLANDAPAAHSALLRWAASAWPEHPPRSLPALAQRVGDRKLRAEVEALDRTLYAPHDHPWQGEPLWRLAKNGLAPPPAPQPPEDDGLPALYPR
jgi:hypothetical protein